MHAFDRQTDRRTDRNLIVRPRCIPCSAVKMELKNRIFQYGKYQIRILTAESVTNDIILVTFL